MKASRRFVVSSRVPASLAGLEELAKNWQWSWRESVGELFARLDSDAWAATGGVPLETLRRARQDRLDAAANDSWFLADLARAVDDQRDTRTGNRWFQTEKAGSPLRRTDGRLPPACGVDRSDVLGHLGRSHTPDLGLGVVAQ